MKNGGVQGAVNVVVLFEIMQATSAVEPAPHSTPAVELVFLRTSAPDSHLKTLMMEVLPPFVKSLVIRRSPSLCVPTNFPPVVPPSSPMGFWKNQKPTALTPLDAGLS